MAIFGKYLYVDAHDLHEPHIPASAWPSLIPDPLFSQYVLIETTRNNGKIRRKIPKGERGMEGSATWEFFPIFFSPKVTKSHIKVPAIFKAQNKHLNVYFGPVFANIVCIFRSLEGKRLRMITIKLFNNCEFEALWVTENWSAVTQIKFPVTLVGIGQVHLAYSQSWNQAAGKCLIMKQSRADYCSPKLDLKRLALEP